MNCKLIYISIETHGLIKRYASLKQAQDNLCKSYETRILEFLARMGLHHHDKLKMDELRKKYLDRSGQGIPFNLRETTLNYLITHANSHFYESLDKSLNILLESAINQIHVHAVVKEVDGLNQQLKASKMKLKEMLGV